MNRRTLSRRGFLKTASLAGWALLVPNTLRAASDASRPNIVLIMADDMGYSDIGCYGGEIDTPHIDALAAGGLRFTQFYNTSRCCPTRASLMTGLYPHQAGVGHMTGRDMGPGYRGYINDTSVTIAEVLKTAGYQTIMTGKWHAGTDKGHWPEDRGFERFYGIHIYIDSYFKVLPRCEIYENGKLVIPATATPKNDLHPDREWYTTDVFTDRALKFLDEAIPKSRNKAKTQQSPFFLYVAYNAPHWPLEAPDGDIAKYTGKYLTGWAPVRKQRFERMRKMGIIDKAWKLSPTDVAGWDTLSAEQKRNMDFRRAIYAAQIDRLDQNVGRLVKRLKDDGVLDNTLILFLSDNGCSDERGMFGYQHEKHTRKNFKEWRKKSYRSSSQGQAWANASNTPFRLFKKWVHEGGIATPLIAHWPARIKQKGRLTHQTGHVIDIMATCCDVAGATYPKTFNGKQIHRIEGKSLVPVFAGRQRPGHNAIFWEHEGHTAVRQDKWKLVSKDGKDATAWELYDLDADRTETTDLAAKRPERVAKMKALWTAWAREANVLPWPKQRRS